MVSHSPDSPGSTPRGSAAMSLSHVPADDVPTPTTIPAVTDRLVSLAEQITTRRTSMQVVGDREVPVDLVEQLCELAAWAPCHKRTWPWRFALVTGDSRARLGEVASAAMAAAGDEGPKVDKTRTKYLRTPAMLVVGSVPGDSPTRTAENRDATAAAVQNLLLAAHAAGLSSFWSSCPKGANDQVAQWCDFPPDTIVVAMIYLGWANDTSVPTPERPPVELIRRD